MVTYHETITADGNYDLSVIMKLALAKARREYTIGKKYGVSFARELRDALRNVWDFARAYRWTIRQRIARAATITMQEAA